jgi:hypothetical protein
VNYRNVVDLALAKKHVIDRSCVSGPDVYVCTRAVRSLIAHTRTSHLAFGSATAAPSESDRIAEAWEHVVTCTTIRKNAIYVGVDDDHDAGASVSSAICIQPLGMYAQVHPVFQPASSYHSHYSRHPLKAYPLLESYLHCFE